jgi:hypothetical protein
MQSAHPAADRSAVSPAALVVLVIAAVALLALHQHLIDLAALAQHGTLRRAAALPLMDRAFYLGLPYRVVDPEFGAPRWIHLTVIAVAAAESGVLYGLYRALRARTPAAWERVLLAGGAAAMLALALHAGSVLGFDLYAYAGYAKLGAPAAYAPPAAPFPGDFGAINTAWGLPMVPCPYGPLWIVIAQLAAGGAKTLAAAVFALRLLAVVPFGLVAFIAGRSRGLAFAALVALNPGLYVLYVQNGHNDLLAVAAVLGALALAGTLPLAAALLVAAAGLLKLPFAASALLVFAGRGALARRAAWAALAIALVAGGSLLAGSEYVHYLLFRAHEYNAPAGLSSLTAVAIRSALLALAALALLTAFVRGTVWRAASWAFVASSSTVYPWYLATCIPYAALEPGALAALLVLFPPAAAVLDVAFPHLGLGQAGLLVMLLAGAYEVVRKRSRPIDRPLLPRSE